MQSGGVRSLNETLLPEQDETRRVEDLLTKRAALSQKQADLEKRIRDLGSLPADAFEKYRDRSANELHRLLHKAQQQLKQYGCACIHHSHAVQLHGA